MTWMREQKLLQKHLNCLVFCLCCTLLSYCLQSKLGFLELDFKKKRNLPGKLILLCVCLLQDFCIDHKREEKGTDKVLFSASALTQRNAGVILLQSLCFSKGLKPMLSLKF